MLFSLARSPFALSLKSRSTLDGEAPPVTSPDSNVRRICDQDSVESSVAELASYVLNNLPANNRAAIVGIRTRGWVLAQRVFKRLADSGQAGIELGALDITLYRDDLSTLGSQPIVGKTEINFPIDGCTVFLLDDVIYTGRTVRAAIDALIEFGRPAAIRLAVLVDRGHREYPINADHAAIEVETTADNIVEVRLLEVDGEDAVDLITR